MADVIMKVDDLDGTPIPPNGGGSVRFGFRGKSYEIDLTSEHEEELAALLARYIEKAKELDAVAGGGERTPQATDETDLVRAKLLQAEARENLAAGKKPYDTIAARAWLSEQGIEFNQMGPLKKEFRRIYEAHYGLPPYEDAAPHAS
ncbi:Lsr2 family protein [Leucobacter weissii]|uniref:Lsr2 family protein n=1 Tax=Leucobacter weissii TaxID=1983706 RepID=A0A939MKH5_9MICO|nr:histone-like nucleoid-structuring protein Lsr2 [Leucobacter weissii]MBO1902251.1 Lsr2 family protein [Leucobacter weissii]